ncbi:hypothetical protein PAHAL_9G404600 [Panicum hallii]|uniref:Uncharacterized protein n=1 Tax=Panicum hallii TaxID=206008 RepID=A0A2T8I470_9POAL|nr:hypothetical protein PAHAL_9G404600 [Panicum hallii]
MAASCSFPLLHVHVPAGHRSIDWTLEEIKHRTAGRAAHGVEAEESAAESTESTPCTEAVQGFFFLELRRAQRDQELPSIWRREGKGATPSAGSGLDALAFVRCKGKNGARICRRFRRAASNFAQGSPNPPAWRWNWAWEGGRAGRRKNRPTTPVGDGTKGEKLGPLG